MSELKDAVKRAAQQFATAASAQIALRQELASERQARAQEAEHSQTRIRELEGELETLRSSFGPTLPTGDFSTEASLTRTQVEKAAPQESCDSLREQLASAAADADALRALLEVEVGAREAAEKRLVDSAAEATKLREALDAATAVASSSEGWGDSSEALDEAMARIDQLALELEAANSQAAMAATAHADVKRLLGELAAASAAAGLLKEAADGVKVERDDAKALAVALKAEVEELSGKLLDEAKRRESLSLGPAAAEGRAVAVVAPLNDLSSEQTPPSNDVMAWQDKVSALQERVAEAERNFDAASGELVAFRKRDLRSKEMMCSLMELCRSVKVLFLYFCG